MFFLAAAGVNKKPLRNAYLQFPFLGRNTAEPKDSRSLRKRWSPGFGGKSECAGGKCNGAVQRRRRMNVIREQERVVGADGPGLHKLDEGIAGIFRRRRQRPRISIHRDRYRAGTKAPAGKTHPERIQLLSAGILQMVFSGDVKQRLRLWQEGNLNFLLFDKVARAQRSGTARDPADRSGENKSGKNRGFRAARYHLTIVAVSGEQAKGEVQHRISPVRTGL